jgi:hypothetical protein
MQFTSLLLCTLSALTTIISAQQHPPVSNPTQTIDPNEVYIEDLRAGFPADQVPLPTAALRALGEEATATTGRSKMDNTASGRYRGRVAQELR